MTLEVEERLRASARAGMSVEQVLESARRRICRVAPSQVGEFVARGGLLVDIRPEKQRLKEGEMPGAVVVERNVLEWRLEPGGEHCLAQVKSELPPVLVVCSEGYASSLAAASIVDLGYEFAGDLDGGYQAWKRFNASKPSCTTRRDAQRRTETH